MKQSRGTSLLKSVISTGAGFGVSLAAQYTILPLLGVAINLEQNLKFAVIMTVISIFRGYLLERFFEFIGMRHKLTAFMHAVIFECFRQRDQEGWSVEHDDELKTGDLALAGACYAESAGMAKDRVPIDWPWSDEWWKPAGFRRDLVRAAALIIAEGDKFDRSGKRRV